MHFPVPDTPAIHESIIHPIIPMLCHTLLYHLLCTLLFMRGAPCPRWTSSAWTAWTAGTAGTANRFLVDFHCQPIFVQSVFGRDFDVAESSDATPASEATEIAAGEVATCIIYTGEN